MKKLATASLLATTLLTATPALCGVYMGTDAAIPQKLQPEGCDDNSGWPCHTHSEAMPQKRATAFTATVHDGSLKGNLERIIEAGHWKKVVWKLPYDYQWVGKTDFTGDSIETVVAQILKHYPLQAVFYSANHVVEILPRYQYNV